MRACEISPSAPPGYQDDDISTRCHRSVISIDKLPFV
jgi:hypothetical protein